MKNEIAVKMSPEGLEVANAYLELGNVPAVCARLKISENDVSEFLAKYYRAETRGSGRKSSVYY